MLTPADRLKIVELWVDTQITKESLAARFGVSVWAIRDLLRDIKKRDPQGYAEPD